nr:MAG TPA: hypothetical protein [Caudoviricetes sp.]
MMYQMDLITINSIIFVGSLARIILLLLASNGCQMILLAFGKRKLQEQLAQLVVNILPRSYL